MCVVHVCILIFFTCHVHLSVVVISYLLAHKNTMNNTNKFTVAYIYYVSVSSQAVISNYAMYARIPCILLSTSGTMATHSLVAVTRSGCLVLCVYMCICYWLVCFPANQKEPDSIDEGISDIVCSIVDTNFIIIIILLGTLSRGLFSHT